MTDPTDAGTATADTAATPSVTEHATTTRTDRAARQSRRGRRSLVWALALVAVLAAAVAAYFGLSALGRARAAQADFDAAVELMDAAEDDLVTVDDAVQAEITSELATRAAEALPLAAEVRADAIAAISLIDGALAELPSDSAPLAEALKESAHGRSEMMDEAPTILEAEGKAARALAPADAAVEQIKAAEDLTAKAVAEFNKHTKAGVQASTTYSNEAEAKLKTARSLLETATAAFPEADFSAFTAYIDAKLALVADSRAIDSLWLAGKIEDSNKKLDAYNKKDAETVAMAEALPDSVRDPIADAYDALTAAATERYFAARERARAADERVKQLRETTGTD